MRYLYAVVAGLAIAAVIAVWWMLSSINHATGASSDQLSFTVAKGQQLRTVARALEKEKLISSAGAWTLYAITQGQRAGILAGDYTLNHGMTGRQILRALTAPDASDQEATVKIPEGATNAEIAQLLERSGVVGTGEFLAAVGATDSRTVVNKEYPWLADKPAAADLQGYLFPDTYRFFKSSTASAVLQKFLDNFDARVTPAMRQAAKDRGQTLFAELTMASILEKELKSDTDRAMGADIFWRRIDIGMPLQSDATVNYVTGKGKLQPSMTDTKVDSPYNTYQQRGLPPGPINNPGLKSIRAALYPKSNSYFYFLTVGDNTYYAKTLDEHNRNKAQYLK
ncbi:MAG: endolytic transglycosylase MltG [Patescibacteria group bacterium]